MKKLFRPVALLCIAAVFTSCVSPYQAQMGALQQAHAAGDVSDAEYRREMARLQMNDAGWQQQNANTATTAAVVGVAALGAAAILDNNHHHHSYYRRGYYHRPRHW